MQSQIVDDVTLYSLEFPEVLREISAFAQSPLGKAKVLGLRPDPDSIREAFRDLVEYSSIITESGKSQFSGVHDIKPLLERHAPHGSFLEPDGFLSIRDNIDSALAIRSMLDEGFKARHPGVAGRIGSISVQMGLLNELRRVFDEKGGIKDNASRRLFAIRKDMRALKALARQALDETCRDKRLKEALQEEIITIRDDRFCLCVKAGKEGEFGGIIHGRSSSGLTFFVEPFKLVDMNNRITCLKKEETSEEIEILKALTSSVMAEKGPLINDLNILAHLDMVQAKALFAQDTSAIPPVISGLREIRLFSARHPLLLLKERMNGPKAVPVDLVLEAGTEALIISGANTGGKTVALKTFGLLAVMALSGIPVPAKEGSSIFPFNPVFSDIGDRQDIIASLSTFSGHVKRIKEFLSKAGGSSLVLIDEIGSGTDPSEGSAFAIAAIEELAEKGAVVVATTHLNALKAHAEAAKAWMNASVMFDEQGLKPLFSINYGVPGSSFGLSIAESLGMPTSLIRRAQGHVDEKEAAFIESIRILQDEKKRVQGLREALEDLEKRRTDAVARFRSDRALFMEKARERVLDRIRRLEKEFSEASLSIKAMDSTNVREAGRLKALARESGEAVLKGLGKARKTHEPRVNDHVVISGSAGTVTKVDIEGKKAEVIVKGLKVWVSWDKIEGIGKTKAKAFKGAEISADMEVSSTINIIGMRSEEALAEITRFIDNAHASGLDSINVVHGVGTGALKKTVEDYLRSNARIVKGFRQAGQGQGGAGVTIVELR